MPEQDHQSRGPLTLAERKQLLVLACTADRIAWVQACQPAPAASPVSQLASELVRYLEPFSHLLPVSIGRWVRGAGFLANVGRQLGWLFR